MPFVAAHLEIFHCTHHPVIPISDLYFTFCSTGRRFTPVGEGGSGRRPLPPQSLNILVGLTLKLLALYCIIGLV